MRRVNCLIALLTIFLVAFALRVFRLDFASLWYDEAFSVYLAQFDLASITARTAADIQPPLYYYLLHFWIALTGASEFSVRFLSLIFGVLTIPLMYVTAFRLFANRAAAFLAALLAMLSPLYVWYSQEARMYTLITFLLLLSSYALLREREGNKGTWTWLFIASNITAVYTHYFAFVVIAFQITFYVLRITQYAPHIKRGALAFASIFIAFLPWTPFVLARFGQDASYWRGALKLDEALRHIFIVFTAGESVFENDAQNIAAGWLVVLVIGLGALILHRKSETLAPHASAGVRNQKSEITFLILYLLVPLALLLFLFSRNPKFNARYLMIASPPFFLLLSAGLANLFSFARRRNIFAVFRVASFAIFVFLVFTSAYAISNAYFDPAFTKASFRAVARYVESRIAPDEAIILTSGHLFPAFNYYYHGDAPTIRLPDEPTLNTERILGFDTANVLNSALASKRGAWVVEWQDEVVDPNGFVPMLLSSQGVEEKITGTNFYQVRLQYWTLPRDAKFSAEPQTAIKRDANFKDRAKLLGATPTPTPADVGASFNLYWQSLDTLDDDYNVALRVRDAAGNLWGKQDRRPAGYNYPTTRWKKDEKLFGAYTVPLLPGTPAGDYFVEVTFYTKSDPSGLNVLAPNGAPIGKTVRVGPIPVLPATKPATLTALDTLRENTLSQPIGAFTLLGYQLGRDKASAGETIPLTLFWRADVKPEKDYTFRIQFGNVTGDALPISNLQSPTSTWRSGEIVRGQYAITIPASAKEGATKLRVVLSDGNTLDLTPFTIEKTDRVFVKPNAQFVQSANFGNTISLTGYQLPITNYKPGDTLKLTLFWNARATLRVDKPYTVFVHLLDKDGKVVAQKDAQPANGARPTTGWIAGEYIADDYELPIAANSAPGAYRIEIGWYDAKDPAFARLQVLDDNGVPTSDHIILQTTLLVQ